MSCFKPRTAGKDYPGRSRLFFLQVVFSAGVALAPPAAVADAPEAAQGLSSSEARGKILYTTGRNQSGAPLYFRIYSAGDRLVPARTVVCASCHGAEGRGGKEGNVLMADISRSALTKPLIPSEPWLRKRVPYTDDQIGRAITGGIDSSGQNLDGMMPRWVIQESDLQDLLQYMKRLGSHD